MKCKAGYVDLILVTGCTRSCHLETSGAASGENFVNVMIFPFQCILKLNSMYLPSLYFHILLFLYER